MTEPIHRRFYKNIYAQGTKLYVTEQDGNFHRRFVTDFKPEYYLPYAEGKYRGLRGERLAKFKFNSISEAKNFLYNQPKHTVFGDIKIEAQYVYENYMSNIKQHNIDDSKINIFTLDIETTTEFGFPDKDNSKEQIILCSFQCNRTKKVYVFSCKEYTGEERLENVEIKVCKTEEELLTDICKFITLHNVDVLTGWNILKFDLPYILARLNKLFGPHAIHWLSPWGEVSEKVSDVKAKNDFKKKETKEKKEEAKDMKDDPKEMQIVIRGVSILDYMLLYEASNPTADSSKLDEVSFNEIGHKKLENPYSTFKEFYMNDYNLFLRYNVMDVKLVDMLEDKMGLIKVKLLKAYKAGINYEDSDSTMKLWDSLIYNYCRDLNIVIPPRPPIKEKVKFKGGAVKDIITGRHKWVVSWDLNSLYPHIMGQYNMSPETVLGQFININVEGVLDGSIIPKDMLPQGYCATANGYLFSTEKRGIFAQMVDDLYEERKIAKGKMLEAERQYLETKNKEIKKVQVFNSKLETAIKLIINGIFGACGSNVFRYYDINYAEGITLSGQLAIKWVFNRLNKFLNEYCRTHDYEYVIASDTDSMMLRLDNVIQKDKPSASDIDCVNYLDDFCKNILSVLVDKAFEDLAETMGAYKNNMKMKREVIADVAIWVAKKNYIMNVWDKEGNRYNPPKLIVKGLAMVKSTTPVLSKVILNESIPKLLYSTMDDVLHYIKDKREQFNEANVYDVSYTGKLNNLYKYSSNDENLYLPKVPAQVRGSILHNHYIKQFGLTDIVPLVETEKIKYVYLKTPNHINENIISYSGSLPKGLNLEGYVDYSTMFDKTVFGHIEKITTAMGWDIMNPKFDEDDPWW